jgi:glycosyltransferase involved in cell wall biosynthesis
MKLLAYVHLRNIYGSTGAGVVARSLTEQLAIQPNMDLQILADPADHARIIPKVGEPWSSYKYHFLPHETSNQQARWIVLNRPPAEDFWREADIVFCTAESYVPKRKARLVVTIHDAAYFEPHAHIRNRAFWATHYKWRVLYQRLLRNADMFHTVSQFSADRLAHYFPAMKNRLRVVHNAVAEDYFLDPASLGDALHDPIFGKGPYVFLPGGLHFRKNAELVFEAWPMIHAKHPDLRLLVGNHCAASYLERAKQMGNSVQLLGFVDNSLLRALYTKAEIAWFPSRYEGFGMPVLEAMACRTPVVTSDCCSLPEIAGGHAVLVPYDKPAEHAEAISQLLDNSLLRSGMSARGRVWAESFRWRRSAQQLREHFDHLL